MWTRRDLKKNAKAVFKRNYWGIVIICTIMSMVMGVFASPTSRIETTLDYAGIETDTNDEQTDVVLADTARTKELTNTDIVDEFLGGIGMNNADAERWTGGVLSIFANNTEGAGSICFGIINAVNQLAFKDRVSPGIVIAVGVLVALAVYIFLKNVLYVGYCRYLIEMRKYTRTKMNRVMFPWHIKRGKKIAAVMLLRAVYQCLWNLTIIGGIIKKYSYMLVPYIAAENPNLGARETIALSVRTMKGNKWQAFKLDVSFVPWIILSILSFNILSIFFVAPYMDLTGCELYMVLRDEAKKSGIIGAEKLCDEYIEVPVTQGEYPVEKYIIPPYPQRLWAHADYNKSYSITSLILIFFAFSFVGWVWEVSLHLFKDGTFVNRGVSYGPWLPIYGAGGVLVLIVLKKLRNKPLLMFTATMALCGIVEYFTSYYLEKTKGMRWWDYSGYFMNLNGRICLEGLFVFAVGGCAAVYIIAPALDNLFNRIPKKIKITLCVVLVTVFLGDQVYSHFVPNSGRGITDYQKS